MKQFLCYFLLLFLIISCGTKKSITTNNSKNTTEEKKPIFEFTYRIVKEIKTGADNFDDYLPLLANKKIGVVTNQSGIITIKSDSLNVNKQQSIVDFLLGKNINIQKIFAPEHGFRGTADAGETIVDGKDPKTGLPLISLYGDNKKPKPNQLEGIEIILFDLQDVGARFYTYISTLTYIMEACAENNIQLIVLDRPNPNIAIIDGPILESEFKSFVGMHKIPILHGMTIGEYAKMIKGENWLETENDYNLTVIPCKNYARDRQYSLPVKPSPNLPNDQSINLYASLCLFEGTNVSVGRGTETQFQVYGSPFLPIYNYSFTPIPNLGAKEPVYKNQMCFGEDLTKIDKIDKLELQWLINTYQSTSDRTKFFNSFFTKLAGTKKLQSQIESGTSEIEIRKTWAKGLTKFKKMREKYLIYK